MKKNKKTASILLLIMATILFAGSISMVSAYLGSFGQRNSNYSAEKHALMQSAFETNDYNLWKSQMQGRGRMMDMINENNFYKFAEMHRLMKAGKYEEAKEIKSKLGMGNGDSHCGNWKNKTQNN